LAEYLIEPERIVMLASLITLITLSIMLIARYAPPPITNIFQYLGESVLGDLPQKGASRSRMRGNREFKGSD